ncbi:hypothetical protein PanWU01x14_011430 [Parasponia andersonii]|uniref:Uncharacterized protein n=1 Tax=Parasponia andersonii TaxID=3476 RepID=A0A2P5E1L9_PARAD|nr:hypothetical protein PanWU01x14_011430 [Parasponia andersonii]
MGLVEVTTGGEGIRVVGSGFGAKRLSAFEVAWVANDNILEDVKELTVVEWLKKLVGVVWAETKSSMIAHGGGIAFLFGFALL